MDVLNVYTLSDIISYCDVDTKLIIRNINKLLCDCGKITLTSDKYIDSIKEQSAQKEQSVQKEQSAQKEHIAQERFILGIINNSWRLLNYAIKNNINNIDDFECGATYACQYNNIDMLKLFISKGISDYEDIVYSACFYGHYDIVKLLLTEPKTHSEKGYGFSIACGAGHLEIVKLLFDEKSDLRWAFENACCGSNINVVNYLIEKGINGVDMWNHGLFLGCQNKQSEIIKLMIEKGANHCMNCELSMKEHLEKNEKIIH